jgi:hypothetical protein
MIGSAVCIYSRHRPAGATIPLDPGTVTISRLRHGGSGVVLASATDEVGVGVAVGIGVAAEPVVLLFTVGAGAQAQRHIPSKAANKRGNSHKHSLSLNSGSLYAYCRAYSIEYRGLQNLRERSV